jgi:hypothetical protein
MCFFQALTMILAGVYPKETPLKIVQDGRGYCDPSASGNKPEACGGEVRGKCTSGRVCECFADWTGPHCLAHRGRDPIIYDAPDQISDIGFEPPVVKSFRFLLATFVVLVAGFVFMVRRNKYQKAGWTSVPDADVSVRTKNFLS